MKRCLLALALCFSIVLPAGAHVGNKDVFEQVTIGPYKLFVTIRTPLVVPGVATIEVRSVGAPIDGLTMTPLLLTGEASKHPPTPDPMKRSADDPQFYTGTLWFMTTGEWQVRFTVTGASGTYTTSVPVTALPTRIMTMQKPLGFLLAALGLLLLFGSVGIVAGAIRESRLTPGVAPDAQRRKRALIAGTVALLLVSFAIWRGNHWWNVEAANYADGMHKNSELVPTLHGDELKLKLRDPDKDSPGEYTQVRNDDLMLDHGHVMHLYAIREPEMDEVLHLHPQAIGEKGLAMLLPSMPAGTYKLYADVVFQGGWPETETATLTVPANVSQAPLAPEDAIASPTPLSAGMLGTTYKLPDGYSMVWDKPSTVSAETPYLFRFTLLDPQGKPAADMQPYLGMAGHAAFVKTDWTAFAHTHPEGTAAMPSMMLAEQSSMPGMDMSAMPMTPEVIKPIVEFPYGFPTAGRYRIFVQMKHGGTVETGVFDAQVQ